MLNTFNEIRLGSLSRMCGGSEFTLLNMRSLYKRSCKRLCTSKSRMGEACCHFVCSSDLIVDQFGC